MKIWPKARIYEACNVNVQSAPILSFHSDSASMIMKQITIKNGPIHLDEINNFIRLTLGLYLQLSGKLTVANRHFQIPFRRVSPILHFILSMYIRKIKILGTYAL